MDAIPPHKPIAGFSGKFHARPSSADGKAAGYNGGNQHAERSGCVLLRKAESVIVAQKWNHDLAPLSSRTIQTVSAPSLIAKLVCRPEDSLRIVNVSRYFMIGRIVLSGRNEHRENAHSGQWESLRKACPGKRRRKLTREWRSFPDWKEPERIWAHSHHNQSIAHH